MKSRPSIQLKSIMEHIKAAQSPPPAPANTSLREWFTGLVVANPVIMNGIAPENRVAEAIRIADDLMKALAAPRAPSLESMAAPSEEEMQHWDAVVETRTRETVPSVKSSRKKTLVGVAIPTNPPPDYEPPPTQRARSIPPPSFRTAPREGGRYTIISPQTNEVTLRVKR